MTQDHALQLMADLLWTGLAVVGPILAVTLLVGLMVSAFQVVTQLQEMSLSYIPKLAVTAAVLMLFGGWMLGQITAFARRLFEQMAALG
jgi:flagellar biosynthetic protein FliQ